MIKFDSVVKRYPDGTTAVDGLDLVAPSGQITVLVGPSGCGKTTSLRMVNRMVEPTSGTVWLDDRDTASGRRRPSCAAASATSSSTPACSRTARSSTTSRPCRCCSAGTRRKARAAGDGAAGAGRAADRARQALPGPALRRPAAAGRRRPGAGRRPAGDAHGRAVQRGRPGGAGSSCRTSSSGCRRELGKTIVFVTHDIDEAVKLGDQVAVMRVGGRLAQLATPAELLADPADDFVAGFVGRDRGYRALGFRAAGDLPLHQEPTVRLGADAGRGRRTAGGRLGARGRRRAAARRAGSTHRRLARPARDRSSRTLLHRGGTLATPGRLAAGRARRGAVLAVRARRASSTTTAGCSARSPPARWSSGSRPSAPRAEPPTAGACRRGRAPE